MITVQYKREFTILMNNLTNSNLKQWNRNNKDKKRNYWSRNNKLKMVKNREKNKSVDQRT